MSRARKAFRVPVDGELVLEELRQNGLAKVRGDGILLKRIAKPLELNGIATIYRNRRLGESLLVKRSDFGLRRLRTSLLVELTEGG